MGVQTDIEVLRAEIEAAQRRQRRARETMAEAHAPASPAAEVSSATRGAAVAVDAEPAETLDIDLSAAIARAEDVLKGLDGEIARHPRVAVVGALALGIVVGSLLSR